MKTFSWCLDAGKLKTEPKPIVLPCLHSPPYLFWGKIGTQSHSAKFLNWGNHVNSVPDLAASPPCQWPTGLRVNTTLWNRCEAELLVVKIVVVTSPFRACSPQFSNDWQISQLGRSWKAEKRQDQRPLPAPPPPLLAQLMRRNRLMLSCLSILTVLWEDLIVGETSQKMAVVPTVYASLFQHLSQCKRAK